ncbi:MAG TPA: GNAT family N-acetyltransferase [Bacteroidota bacterium]|nr:GNAT family N-acetyltransferase [Bacteroidota bacterium]
MSQQEQPAETAYRFRDAGAADIETILDQRRLMFIDMGYPADGFLDDTLAASREFFSSWMADGRYRAWLVESPGGEVVGGGGVLVTAHLPSPRDPNPRRPLIVNVYTAPAHRRRGLARRLLDIMLAWCRSQGFGSVTLYASSDGKPLYEAAGFVPTNEMRLMLRTASARPGG